MVLVGDSTALGRSVSKSTAAYWPYLRRQCAFCNVCPQQAGHAATKGNLDVAGRTSQLFYTAASRLMCVTRVALPKKPGKTSFVLYYWPCCAVFRWAWPCGWSYNAWTFKNRSVRTANKALAVPLSRPRKVL